MQLLKRGKSNDHGCQRLLHQQSLQCWFGAQAPRQPSAQIAGVHSWAYSPHAVISAYWCTKSAVWVLGQTQWIPGELLRRAASGAGNKDASSQKPEQLKERPNLAEPWKGTCRSLVQSSAPLHSVTSSAAGSSTWEATRR